MSHGDEKCQELVHVVKEFVKSMEKCLQPGSKVRIEGVFAVSDIKLTFLNYIVGHVLLKLNDTED